ncbi:MAG TPA: pitrilysin family protein [Spirochaetota bacterium]|nr:pitrilysin family protein [Spirochaetota bacterium]
MNINFMKRAMVPLLCGILMLFSLSADAENGNLPSLEGLPGVETYDLQNGIRLLTIREELPRTEIICSIGFGKMHEDADNAGLSEIMAKEISLSGTKNFPGNELNEKIEALGGDLSINAGWENITIVIKVLSRHSEFAFSLLRDILENPVFSNENLIYSKRLVMEQFRREMDNPSSAGFTRVREIIFNGRGYGATLSEKSVNSITADTLRETWKKVAVGGNITIAVSSSLEKDILQSITAGKLSGIKKGEREFYNIDNAALLSELSAKSGNIYLLPKDLEQATIITGTIAPEINYQGNYSLFLMNYILGGGSFNSRLMNEIRVKRGLAYSVFSLVRNRYKTGVFMSFVQTRNEEAANVLSLMKENIFRMSEEKVSGDELNWARESVINSYVFNFARTSDILDNYLQIEYNKLDRGYYRDYLKNISRVTPDDIKRESRLLFKQGIVTVVVGNRNLVTELEKHGKVIILE